MATGPSGQAGTDIIGRAAEVAAFEGLLDGATRQGGAVVVRGHPGIGKSALLDKASEMAEERGFAVVAATGVESEANCRTPGFTNCSNPCWTTWPNCRRSYAGHYLRRSGWRRSALRTDS